MHTCKRACKVLAAVIPACFEHGYNPPAHAHWCLLCSVPGCGTPTSMSCLIRVKCWPVKLVTCVWLCLLTISHRHADKPPHRMCRYGFFNNKRIVLFDTLIKECSEEEVVAVLAHGEIPGHGGWEVVARTSGGTCSSVERCQHVQQVHTCGQGWCAEAAGMFWLQNSGWVAAAQLCSGSCVSGVGPYWRANACVPALNPPRHLHHGLAGDLVYWIWPR